MKQPNAFLEFVRMLSAKNPQRAYRRYCRMADKLDATLAGRKLQPARRQHAARVTRRRTVSRQSQDWQMPSRNRLGRDSECRVYNAISHIQASGTHPTCRMISRLIQSDSRQVRRIIKRLELAGVLRWLHSQAKYKNNRRQWVPIELLWGNLRKPPTCERNAIAVLAPAAVSSVEPTLTSTIEPALANSLGSKYFKKENRAIESVNAPACVFSETEKQGSPEEWETETGFNIPDKDLTAILQVINHRLGRAYDSNDWELLADHHGYDSRCIDRDFMAYVVEQIWLRESKPARNWKAYFAHAVLVTLLSTRGFWGMLNRYCRRTELYQKWKPQWCRVAAWPTSRLREYGAQHTQGVTP